MQSRRPMARVVVSSPARPQVTCVAEALVDTGADSCLINEDLARQLKLEKISVTWVLGIQGEPIMRNVVPLQIEMTSARVIVHAAVMPRMDIDIVLGCDFFKETRAVIRWQDGKGTLQVTAPPEKREPDITNIKRRTAARTYASHRVPSSFEPLGGLPTRDEDDVIISSDEATGLLRARKFSYAFVAVPCTDPETELESIQKIYTAAGINPVDWFPNVETGRQTEAEEASAQDKPKQQGLVGLGNRLPPDAQYIVDDYADCLPVKIEGLPPLRELNHEIHLVEGHKNVSRPPFRISQGLRKELDDQINKLLTEGKIRHSTSPFSSPVLFVKKKNGSWRMCIDYRALNQITIRNNHPLPRIDDLLAELSGCKYFSKIDLQSGFHQIRIEPGSEWKSAFSTPYGHYEWLVMPFGMTNAPATFQCLMNRTFAKETQECAKVYMDDFMIHSRTREQHHKDVRRILDKMRRAQLKGHPDKCDFFMTEIEFLGFRISQEGIGPLPDKVTHMVEWTPPETIQAVMAFLGFANYYRGFIPGFATLAKPLYQLTKRGKGEDARNIKAKVEWASEHQTAFEALKKALQTAPQLHYPQLDKPFTLTTDASGTAIGAVLEQDDKPIGFYSRLLKDVELRYPTYEKEALGIYQALLHWKSWLQMAKVTVKTDHKPLMALLSQKHVSLRLARLLTYIQELDVDIQYVPGKTNLAADYLSRPARPAIIPGEPATGTCLTETNEELTSEDVKRMTTPNPILISSCLSASRLQLRRVSTVFELEIAPERAEELAREVPRDPTLEGKRAEMEEREGLWYWNERLVVPLCLRDTILHEEHDPPCVGHPGRDRMLARVTARYWWPGITSDIVKFIKGCETCARSKNNTLAQPGLAQVIDPPYYPWEQVSMDFLSLPPARGPHNQLIDNVFVIVDRLSKRVRLVPCTKRTTSQEFAGLFVDHIIKIHGTPLKIITDRDTVWMSQFFTRMCQLLGIQRAASSARHPQTNGLCERANRTIQEILRATMSSVADWPYYLPLVEIAINNSV